MVMAEEPRRRTILHVVGKRVDIAVGDEWNGRDARTRIILIGKPDGIDEAMLHETFDRLHHQERVRDGLSPDLARCRLHEQSSLVEI